MEMIFHVVGALRSQCGCSEINQRGSIRGVVRDQVRESPGFGV